MYDPHSNSAGKFFLKNIPSSNSFILRIFLNIKNYWKYVKKSLPHFVNLFLFFNSHIHSPIVFTFPNLYPIFSTYFFPSVSTSNFLGFSFIDRKSLPKTFVNYISNYFITSYFYSYLFTDCSKTKSVGFSFVLPNLILIFCSD